MRRENVLQQKISFSNICPKASLTTANNWKEQMDEANKIMPSARYKYH